QLLVLACDQRTVAVRQGEVVVSIHTSGASVHVARKLVEQHGHAQAGARVRQRRTFHLAPLLRAASECVQRWLKLFAYLFINAFVLSVPALAVGRGGASFVVERSVVRKLAEPIGM